MYHIRLQCRKTSCAQGIFDECTSLSYVRTTALVENFKPVACYDFGTTAHTYLLLLVEISFVLNLLDSPGRET